MEHAVALLEEVGLAGFTGREVARRAGVSHGAPRRHFTTLAALLSAVAVSGFHDLRTRLEAAVAQSPSAAIGQILSLATEYVAFAQERPAMFELMFRHDLLEDSGEHLREHSLPVFALVLAAVTEADVAEPLPLAVDLWTGVHGIAVLSSRRALEVLASETTEALVERQVRAHLGRSDAQE